MVDCEVCNDIIANAFWMCNRKGTVHERESVYDASDKGI